MNRAHIADILLRRAEHTPDTVAFEFVDETGRLTSMTYAELADRAATLAARLPTGAPALLAYPAGLSYVVGVCGAFLAGVPVVPAYPPGASDADRLARIAADAGIGCVLAPEDAEFPTAAARIAVPERGDGTAPTVAPGEVAIIQYTSGSTGVPRGVVVSHDNLAANTAAIADRFGLHAGSRAVSWLPPFHDMGLVGGILTPIAAAMPMRLMAPGDFLKAPLRWLRQIADSAATVSGGPNFAYDLCVRRATDDAVADLDLSRWAVAFNGAEPVRHRTLAAFADRFAGAGFRPEAFLPCYGLAEATLIVAAGHWDPTTDPTAPTSCGTPVDGQRIAVVDADGHACADGDEGEIWLAGPHVTSGYWTGGDEDLFGELAGRRMLRTGDLGWMRDGELRVTGRTKDVIVHRGVNHHAVDVESAALAPVGDRARSAAAFQVETGPGALVGLVVEVAGREDPADRRALAADVSAAVTSATGLRLDVLALVPPRSIPRTSSGKVRRSAVGELYRAGAYDDGLVVGPRPGDAAAELTDLIRGIAAEVCDVPGCGPDDSLIALGADSLRAAEAAAVVEDVVGAMVPLEVLLECLTPRRIADRLLERWTAEGIPPADVRARIATATRPVGADA